jgi:hypothetical protein
MDAHRTENIKQNHWQDLISTDSLFCYCKCSRENTVAILLVKSLPILLATMCSAFITRNTVLDVKILQRLQFYLEEKHNNYNIKFTKSFLRLLRVKRLNCSTTIKVQKLTTQPLEIHFVIFILT